MSIPVVAPYPVYTDRSGEPIESGYVYIGVANQNPITNPITVYWDVEGTIPAAQPLRTQGGYIYRNGTPTNVFVNSACSIVVKDSNGALVYSEPELELGIIPLIGSGGSALIGFLQAGTGAVARTVQSKLRDVVSITDFGCVGDDSTDNSTGLNAAIVACATANTATFVPSGTFRSGKATIFSDTALVGQGVGLSILKLKNSANTDLIYGDGSDALWGTNTDAGISNWQLSDLTLDGNRANNSSGSCIAVYGQKPTITNVWIKDSPEHGMRTEWYQFGEAVFGMEGFFSNIRIDTVGKHGWLMDGPHDSHAEAVVVIDASQTTTNLYDGIQVGANGAGHFYNCHPWARSATVNNVRYAFNVLSSGSEFIGCMADTGTTGNFYLGPLAQFNLVSALRCTGSRAGKNLIVRGNFNRVSGTLSPKFAGSAAVVGISLGTTGGDSVVGNVIDMVCAEQLGGVIDWTYTGGSNKVTVRGVQASGGTNYTGAPSASDVSDIRITGTGNFRLVTNPYFVGITAAGSAQGDATALDQGYKLYQIGTAAASTGVRLWSTVQAGEDNIMIANAGANTVNVYPASGDQINLSGANVAVTIASGDAAIFSASSTGQWYTPG